PWGDGKPVAMVDVLPGRVWHAESTHGLNDRSRFFRLSGKAATLFPRRHKESHFGWFTIGCATAGLRFAGPIHRLEIGRSSVPPETWLLTTRRPIRLLARSQVRQAA